jgi:hypothetical protein
MKRIAQIILSFLLIGCSSVEIVENWKNPDIDVFETNKVLIVGITSNANAKRQFENQLKQEYQARGIEAYTSLEVFQPDFTSEKQSEESIKKLEDKLIANHFDAILLTKVIGVEDKIAYKNNYGNYDETDIRFKEDFLMYQDIYFNPDYYNEYAVYHTESSLYCLCPAKDRELIWKGYIDITDPQNIDETVADYVKLVAIVLEEQGLMVPEKIKEERSVEEAI